MHSRAQFPLQVLLLTAALCLGVAHTGYAGGTFHGSITGSFSAPVLSGNLANADGTPNSTFLNNSNAIVNGITGTNTAVCSLASCPVSSGVVGSNEFHWGANPAFSSFVFTGASNVAVPGGSEFELGTFDYFNGESALNTLVFGVTLTLEWHGTDIPAGTVTPLVRDLKIGTTVNGGVDPIADSDSVQFTITANDQNLDTLLHVLEGTDTTATGTCPAPPCAARAHLMGKISGDPFLELTRITVSPDDPNGFVTVVPEPGSLILLGLGLGGIALTRRLRPVKR